MKTIGDAKKLKEIRKKTKKQNLEDAKSHFPFKLKVTNKPSIEIKSWLIKNHFRSWKQKGLEGDYFTTDNKTYWFKTKEKLAFFVIAMK